MRQWAQQVDGQLWPILVGLARYESTFDPRAVGDDGCSYGLTQWYTCNGLGTGHDPAKLQDGPTNLTLTAAHLRQQLARGKTLWDALQPWFNTRKRALDYAEQIAPGWWATPAGMPAAISPDAQTAVVIGTLVLAALLLEWR